jgi:hypothetical protein
VDFGEAGTEYLLPHEIEEAKKGIRIEQLK